MPFKKKQQAPAPPVIRLPNFTPRGYQLAPYDYLDSGGARVMTVIHRRGGKDYMGAHYCAKRGHVDVGAYYHLFPTEKQGRKALWMDYTSEGKRKMELIFPKEVRKHPKGDFHPEAEMVVVMTSGSTYRIVGADKVENVGAGPLGLIFSEFSLMKPTIWPYFAPMLREPGPGGRPRWAWFNFTPRGANHAKELFDRNGPENGWFKSLQTVHDTGLMYMSSQHAGKLITPAEMMAEERADGMPDEMVRQEYLCDFTAANVGAIWGKELAELERSGRVCEFECFQDDVFVNMDLGRNDATAFWLWQLNDRGGINLLQHHEIEGGEAEQFCDWLQAQTHIMGWRYAAISLPHDGRARTCASGVSVEDIFRKRFAGLVRITPNIPKDQGLKAGRKLLQLPTFFHPRCSSGLSALRHYHRHWDADKKIFSDEPVHDWSSNTADAFRYVAVDYEHSRIQLEARRSQRKERARIHRPPTTIGTLEDMFRDEERKQRWMN